jgi:uncharacterized protein (DUF433 family)
MQTAKLDEQGNGVRIADLDAAELEDMVGPDRNRTGSVYARLRAENIPVRAVIGQLMAVAGTWDLSTVPDDVIAEVADDYNISRKAVLAALLYYREHACAIDALLEANQAVRV